MASLLIHATCSGRKPLATENWEIDHDRGQVSKVKHRDHESFIYWSCGCIWVGSPGQVMEVLLDGSS